jgi:hypothetical protein
MPNTPDWDDLARGFITAWNDGDYYTKNVLAEVEAISTALSTREGSIKARKWGREVVSIFNDGDFYSKDLQTLAEEAAQFTP